MALFRRAPKDPEGRMSLADHLRELRRRVVVAAVAVVASAVVAVFYYNQISAFLQAPFTAYQRANPTKLIQINFAEATSGLSNLISISIWVGIIASSPIWLYQVWAFIAPGLTRREKRLSMTFLAAATPLFLGGVALAYVVMPTSLAILYGLTPDNTSNIQDANIYYAFVTRFIMVFGIGFLFPLVLVGLNVLGMLSARRMLGGWRIALVGILVFAAAATPTSDAYTLFVFAGPLMLLFFAACGVAAILDRRRAKARPEWLDVSDDQPSAL